MLDLNRISSGRTPSCIGQYGRRGSVLVKRERVGDKSIKKYVSVVLGEFGLLPTPIDSVP